MTDWTKMRKTWTDARDKAKVKKGAVSGVSIGDAIEAVVKAEAKGYNAVFKATEALAVAFGKYKAKLAKSNPDLIKVIDNTFLKEIKEYQGQVRADIGNVTWIRDMAMGDTIMSPYGLNPDSGNLKQVDALIEASKPKPKKAKAGEQEQDEDEEQEDPSVLTWKQAADQSKLFTVTNASLPRVGKRALDMSKLVWNAKLTGHDADYAAFKDWAGAAIEDVKYCAKWSKVDTHMEFLNMLRAWGERETAYSYDAKAQKAIATLLG